jgi:uncharacterized protein YcnI
MRQPSRAFSRALISIALAGATTSLGLLAGPPAASAHVRVSADNTTPGSYAVLTFKVPNESEKGALTTQLTVALPDLTSASTELMPGWTVRLDRDAAAGTVRSISWTAAPGGGIPPDQFALFRVSVKLPPGETLDLPTTQTYSDGTVVKWDQPTPAGGDEPDYPAPELALTAADLDSSHNWSTWLAGGALIVAVAALAVVVVDRRRT